MNILIVDAHAVIHQGIMRILADQVEHVTFGSAKTSHEALAHLSGETWDVVILDVDLPGRGGIDLLKQIHGERPTLPILVFSFRPEKQLAVRTLIAGASGYVAKDCEPAQLIEAVRKVARGGRYVSPALAEILAGEIGQDVSRSPQDKLSDREYSVLRMIATGMTTGAIAAELALSVKTVSTYRSRILEKLGLATTVELIRFAVDRNLDR